MSDGRAANDQRLRDEHGASVVRLDRAVLPRSVIEAKELKTRVIDLVKAGKSANNTEGSVYQFGGLANVGRFSSADGGEPKTIEAKLSPLLYLDADIEASASIKGFLADVDRLIAEDMAGAKHCAAFFLRERFWYSLKTGHKWNSGAFLLPQTDTSAPTARRLLAAWRSAIRTLRPKLDQTALMEALSRRERRSSPEPVICPLPQRHFTFVPSASNLIHHERTAFTHWAKTSRTQNTSRRKGASSLLLRIARKSGGLRGVKAPQVQIERKRRVAGHYD